MKFLQSVWTKKSGWDKESLSNFDANLVFIFGHGEYFVSEECFNEIKAFFPAAIIIGCSTSGAIKQDVIFDEAVVLNAIKLEKSTCKLVYEDLCEKNDSYSIGSKLAQNLQDKDLKHIFVLSDGLNINGTQLALGFSDTSKVSVSGGLAGDMTAFANTYVVANAMAKEKRVAAIGFYGDVVVGVGCESGWDEFGVERVITKAKNNIVFEIDGKPALELYKSYLGDEAALLPSSGLKFPIAIKTDSEEKTVIRTLLAVNEEDQSLTFAGDVPEGIVCILMKANLDKLIDNSELASHDAKPNENSSSFSIAVSCVGRRLVLGQLVEDEIDVIKSNYPKNNLLTGFYSYGEIAPQHGFINCKLHNQTMTITTITENA